MIEKLSVDSNYSIKMVKSVVMESYPSIPMRILTKPRFSLSPPMGEFRGQPVLGRQVGVSQYVSMGQQSNQMKKMLQLPETEPIKVVKGYEKIAEDRVEPTTSADDLKIRPLIEQLTSTKSLIFDIDNALNQNI